MKSPFIIVAILIQIIHFTTAQTINNNYPIIRCQTFNNITTTTTAYKTNIMTALTSVASAVASNYGFKKTTIGEGPNTVTAVAMCRGDIDSETCNSCIANSSVILTQNCPNRIEALVWNMNCSLLYSNRTYASTFYNRPYGKILSYVNVSNVIVYNEALRALAARLRTEAAGGNLLRKFATGDVVFGQGLEKIYAMVQCTPDLSSFDCNSCLSVVFREAQGCCDGDTDVSVYYTSCSIRYSNMSFYNDPPLISLPSLQPPSSDHDTYKELFTIHFHYDGKFVQNPNKEYVDGKVGTFDFIEHETFSMHEFDAIITELECENGSMYRHFMIPETCLDNGLRPIKTDKDISKMLSYVPAFQEINVYLTTVDEEEYFRSTGELIDEIDAELNLVDFKTRNKYNVATSSEPVRGFVGEQSKPPVKDNNEPFLDEDIEDSETRQEENDSENEEDSDGRTEVDDSQDDDFDPLKEIDFDEFGDDGDDGNEKGNVALEVDPADEFEVDMSKFNFNFEVEGGNVQDFTPKIGELAVNEEVVAIDFDDFESGPDVNSEGERRMKLKHLRRNMGKDSDLVVKNRFYVGQVFGSKKPVKQMLKKHAIETRRDIKMVKDDKVRLRARCFGQVPEPKPRYTKSKVALEKEILASPEKAKGVNSQEVKGKGVVGDIKGKGVVGDRSEKSGLKKPTCPWTLHVSKGKGEDRWMVKTLILEHKCLQLRHLRQCTSTFISQQILDTVDADPRIKGAAIQDIVSKSWCKSTRCKSRGVNLKLVQVRV